MPMLETKATTFAPDQFAHGRVSFFTVAADLQLEADLKAFYENAATLSTIIQLGERSATEMRFVVENNGVTAAQLSAVTGETVTDFVL